MADYTIAELQDMITNTWPLLGTDTDKPIWMLPQQRWNGLAALKSTRSRNGAGKYVECRWNKGAAALSKASRYISPGQKRNVNLTTSTETCIFQYGIHTYQVTYLEHEIISQDSDTMILDEMKRKKSMAQIQHWTGIDSDIFTLPTFAGTVGETPVDEFGEKKAVQLLGFPYHLPKITYAQSLTSTATGAFQGANPDGFSYYGTMDRSLAANAEFRTYNASYGNSTGVFSEDVIMRIRRMHKKLDFQTPPQITDYSAPAFSNYGLFTCDTIEENAIKYARSQNDNMTADLMESAGTAYMFRKPIQCVEALNTDVELPFYLINFNMFENIVNPMCNEKVRKVTYSDIPDAVTVHVDTQEQIVTIDPQKCGGVISLANP